MTGERSWALKDKSSWAGTIALGMAAAVVLLSISGCAQPVHLDPAAKANTEACAAVMVRLPQELGNLPGRDTDAQATMAWGSPAAVLVRCGVESPAVSPLQCLTLGNVDWLIDTSNKNFVLATTYGRTPAVEVVIDSDLHSPGTFLEDLAPAVSQVPAEKHCL